LVCKGKYPLQLYLDKSGLLGSKIIAPVLFDASIDIAIFCEWIIEGLMTDLPKKSIIVMDNASFHKDKNIQKVIVEEISSKYSLRQIYRSYTKTHSR
jgi:hypothetical protein